MTALARDHTETMDALHDPQVGDRFHEMYSFWMYVLAVTPTHVTIISASSPCTFPDDGKVETLTRDAFVERFSYGTIPGAWVSLRNKGSNVAGWLLKKTPRLLDEVEQLREIAQSARILVAGHAREPYYEAEWARLEAALKAVDTRENAGKDVG